MRYQLATIAVLSGIAILGAMQSPAWQTNTNNLTHQCEQIVASSEVPQSADVCMAADDSVTWGEWFSGESRSTQFHFLDFFELLFAEDSKRDYRGGDYAGPKLRL